VSETGFIDLLPIAQAKTLDFSLINPVFQVLLRMGQDMSLPELTHIP